MSTSLATAPSGGAWAAPRSTPAEPLRSWGSWEGDDDRAPLKIEWTASTPEWAWSLDDDLNRLWMLPAGWDGRHAARVSLTAVESMVRWLSAVMPAAATAPQLVPTTDGGLQAEWHAHPTSVELEVEADGGAHVLAVLDGTIVVNEELPAAAGGMSHGLRVAVSTALARLSIDADRARQL